MPLEDFINYFLEKSPWKEQLIKSDSALNRLLRLEKLFLVRYGEEDSEIGGQGASRINNNKYY